MIALCGGWLQLLVMQGTPRVGIDCLGTLIQARLAHAACTDPAAMKLTIWLQQRNTVCGTGSHGM